VAIVTLWDTPRTFFPAVYLLISVVSECRFLFQLYVTIVYKASLPVDCDCHGASWRALPCLPVVLSCLLLGPAPLLSVQAILSTEIDWDAPELQPLSAAARDLLERLLQRNPVMRPSAAEALEHPWLAQEGAANDMPLQVTVALAVAAAGLLRAAVT
jgi:serine/threonine protein kinase